MDTKRIEFDGFGIVAPSWVNWIVYNKDMKILGFESKPTLVFKEAYYVRGMDVPAEHVFESVDGKVWTSGYYQSKIIHNPYQRLIYLDWEDKNKELVTEIEATGLFKFGHPTNDNRQQTTLSNEEGIAISIWRNDRITVSILAIPCIDTHMEYPECSLYANGEALDWDWKQAISNALADATSLRIKIMDMINDRGDQLNQFYDKYGIQKP